MARKKRAFDIWKEMTLGDRARFAVAVFFLFAALGPLVVLMKSSLSVIPWKFVLLETVSMGSLPAMIIFFAARRKWLIAPIIIFWSFVVGLNSGGLNIVVTGSGEVRTEFNSNIALTDSVKGGRAIQAATVDASTLRGIYEQRTFLGLIAIGCIVLGYTMLIRVIRKEVRKRARFETEVTIARDIQQSLMGDQRLDLPGCRIAGATAPATEVGGDYFDFVTTAAGDVAICVADVTGHGVGAGILSAMTKSAFRSQVRNDASPGALLGNLNRTLVELSSEKMFVTFAYCLLGGNGRCLTVATAGHQPVLHRSGGKILQHRTPSLALGLRADAAYHSVQVAPVPGDLILLYTDGVVEAANKKGEQYSLDRLTALFSAYSGSPSDWPAHLIGSLRAFTGSASFEDDISCVIFEITGSVSASV
jgi:serine phosphatase RsbU (regulator of sigma subunit)